MSSLTLEAMNCPSPGGKVMEARSSTTSTVYTGLLQGGHRELGMWGWTEGQTGGTQRHLGWMGLMSRVHRRGHQGTQG